MLTNKKFVVLFTMFVFISLAIAFTNPPQEDFKNLKILPKNISHEDLGKIMHQFNTDLGVKCNFCHAANKDSSKHLDFVSDEIDNKIITRKMMRMTIKLNEKFFSIKNPTIGSSNLEVSCFTCHHGEPHPDPSDKKMNIEKDEKAH